MKIRRMVTCVVMILAIALSMGSVGFISAMADDAAKTEVLPIARYDFSDESNYGKDVTGHGHDLEAPIHAKDGDLWQEEGTVNNTTLEKDGDGLKFSGANALAAPESKDFSEFMNGMTLNFRVKDDYADTRNQWKCIIGFGDYYAGLDGTSPDRKMFGFYTKNDIPSGDNTAKRRLYFFLTGVATRDGGSMFGDAPYVVELERDEFADVTLSIQPGGQGYIKVNDYTVDLPFVQKAGGQAENDPTRTIPSDIWDSVIRPSAIGQSSNDSRFCIGANIGYGKAYHGYKGTIADVTIYDFAATKEETAKYWENGYKFYDTDFADDRLVTSISDTPIFKDGQMTINELKDTHTEVQMLKRLNEAYVEATTKDGQTKVQLPVTWTSVKEEDGKYIARGSVKNVGLSYPCIAELTEVSVEVPVTRTLYEVSISQTIENGTIVADKENAVSGDTVTFTVTPAEGYEIEKVTVNGTEITAENGIYSAVMTSEGMQVSASFKEKDSGNPKWVPIVTGVGIALGVVIIAGVVTIIIVKKRKKS